MKGPVYYTGEVYNTCKNCGRKSPLRDWVTKPNYKCPLCGCEYD